MKNDYLKIPIANIPLFHRPFWLDATAGNNWNAIVVKEGNDIVASMPYAFEKKSSGLFIRGPHLTQFLGPSYKIESNSPREFLNRETQLLSQLRDALPLFASFDQRWHFSYQNWLPFHWKNFQQRTRYTYLLPDMKNPDALWNGFNEKIKREIKKAEKEFHISSENISVHDFYNLLKENLSKKNYRLPFSEKFLHDLYDVCLTNHAGKIYLALDSEQKIAAGIFIAWDSTTAYYVIGGKDDAYGNSGAMSFLFWTAFNDLKNQVTQFDFEGSMIQGVENYFRSFGAVQKTYFEITRVDSKLLFLSNEIKKTIRVFLGK